MNGRYGAIIEKVKQGSVADLAGHLLPGEKERNRLDATILYVGDEVLEWNGRSLQSRSYEEVMSLFTLIPR